MVIDRNGIDWDSIIEKRMSQASFVDSGPDYWDRRAPHICGSLKENSYTSEFIKRLDLRHEYSVLDIGAGNGAVTIPLAQKVSKVTSYDISPGMLELLRKNAGAMGITNINIIQGDWLKAEVGRDIKVHDVVVASRCLPLGNLRASLEKMNMAAGRACYASWRIAEQDDLFAEACRILNRQYNPFPEYTIAYNMLYGMGIYANVTIFNTAMHRRYEDIDTAVIQAVRGTAINPDESRLLKDHFSRILTRVDGMFEQSIPMRWALIWWEKNPPD